MNEKPYIENEKPHIDERFYKSNRNIAIYIIVCMLVAWLTVFLIILKLAGVVSISWWGVTAPVWGFLLISTVLLSGSILFISVKNWFGKNKYIKKDLYDE